MSASTISHLEGKLTHRTTRQAIKGLLAAFVLAGVAGVAPKPVFAQALLEKEGTLAPMEDTYTFDGQAGQTLTIELEGDFDTVLQLKGPDGQLLTSNDDYGVTLNSTIVIELPATGTYSAIATSYDGLGGTYQIEVRPTSEYEMVFNRAYELAISEDYPNAVEAYTAAIELNETDPGAYIGRAEATLSRAYLSFTDATGDLDDLPPEVLTAVAADYNKAADLLDQQGQTGPASSLREQAQYFIGEETPAGVAVPTEEVSPDEAPTPQSEDDAADEVIEEPGGSLDPSVEPEMMPVEPDGGIGDGAEPLPDSTSEKTPTAPETEPAQ